MSKRTNAQNKKLYALIGELKLTDDDKAAMALSFSNGRTERSSQLTAKEAERLINRLEELKQQPIKTKRRRLAHALFLTPEHLRFWTYRSGSNEKVLRFAAIDDWFLNSPKSPVRKNFAHMGANELSKAITAIEAMNQKYANHE